MFDQLVPKTLDKFILHKDLANNLKNYNINNFTNTIFYGSESSGKKTLIDALLSHIYQDDINKKNYNYNLKINNNDVEITCVQSKYHFEINLFEYGLYDKHVLCKFVKNVASTKNIKMKSCEKNNSLKIIILHRLDKTTQALQLALRRMMETMYTTCRFIITTYKLSKLNSALKSRCLLIRVPIPSKNLLIDYVDKALIPNNLKLTNANKKNIFDNFNYNLFRLNSLCLFSPSGETSAPRFFVKILHKMVCKKTLNFIHDIREYIYKLHLLDIQSNDILLDYMQYIVENNYFKKEDMLEIMKQAALNDYFSRKSKIYFFSLENFFIHVNGIIHKSK